MTLKAVLFQRNSINGFFVFLYTLYFHTCCSLLHRSCSCHNYLALPCTTSRPPPCPPQSVLSHGDAEVWLHETNAHWCLWNKWVTVGALPVSPSCNTVTLTEQKRHTELQTYLVCGHCTGMVLWARCQCFKYPVPDEHPSQWSHSWSSSGGQIA